MEQGFERAAQPTVEERTRFRVELSAQAPHARLAIDPRAQPRGAALPLEPGDAIVGLGPANLCTHGAPEFGRGGSRGDFGEELVATGQPLLRSRVEPGDALGQHIDMIDVHCSCGQRSAELGEQLDCFSPSKWLKGLREGDPRRVGDDLFGKDPWVLLGELVEPLGNRQRARFDPRTKVIQAGQQLPTLS